MKSLIDRCIKGWIVFWSAVFFIGVFINFLEIILRFFFSYSIDALQSLLKGGVKKAFSILNAAIVLVFGIVFTYGGILFVSELYRFNTVYTRSISVPSWLIEACVPLGLFLFTCCAVYDLYKKIMKNND